MRTTLIILFIVFTLIAINGCLSYDKLVNYRTEGVVADTVMIRNAPQIRIQPDDVLKIKVYGPDELTAAPFNLTPVSADENFVSIESIQLSGYLVDKKGYIDFPVLGAIEVAGLTISEVKDRVREKLMVHLKEVVVNVRLLNFKVTVAGEVKQPGSFFVVNERITIPEALSLAGGLTNYAQSDNVLIVREENGIRTFNRVNLQSTQLFQSDFFYLRQNDFINVDPIKAKIGAVQDQTNKTVPIITAGATLIAVIVSILR